MLRGWKILKKCLQRPVNGFYLQNIFWIWYALTKIWAWHLLQKVTNVNFLFFSLFWENWHFKKKPPSDFGSKLIKLNQINPILDRGLQMASKWPQISWLFLFLYDQSEKQKNFGGFLTVILGVLPLNIYPVPNTVKLN